MKFPISIIVKPKSKRENIEYLDDGSLNIEVKEKAENNKANLAVIKLLSKHFGKQAYIKYGFKSKKKIIDVK